MRVYGESPSYDKLQNRQVSRWKPKTWSWKIWAAAAFSVLAVVAIVVGAVLGTEDSAYPKYSALTYTLQDTYSGTDFFNQFDYFTGYDPSLGFVHYVPYETATSPQYNLTYASSSSAVLRVDTTDTDASTGRYSVRITSKKQYNSGLFIFDVLNSPYGCSTWPALWLTDPNNWPSHGEIDVMEAVNQATTGNQMTLHTTDDCKMNVKRKETGEVQTSNCYNATDENAGCGVQGAADTFGEAFNANGGGIYAMEWRNAGIRIWFFPRSSIPSDIPTDVSNTTAPDPSSWDEPLADFPSTHCDMSSHFQNQSIIANIDLCGAWAGATSVYTAADQCPGTCSEFVTSNATAFKTAYWEWSSWRVYTAS
ncbi:glycoside hydrolase family 16 protein [Baudoinia panamericana UAMH 10762]|uniref:endo-1,3(4)-beta-glucanase n=1 Tax=Baudoinia panamericana (strain UAMH 10762) TaxID=717646 RepID=M2ML21_BAUPA|nr:glycoside hydrolase family 16 protein [Baudoinia panamericana UAMH 10762]EMC92043.1 glycoside hydrolase family 16 protein [Baudoinia panamericana UAMH 10762]